jgi:cytochrome c1
MTIMSLQSLRGAALAALVSLAATPALAAEEHAADAGGGHGIAIARQAWTFGGFFGKFDKDQLQRGWQVYQEVCSTCHGLKRLAFRNLVQPGGPEFPEESVKALAAAWPNKITDGPDDNGKMFERPALLSDPILGPYKNEKEARAAQNGALPPDLSIIAKARNVEYLGTWYAHPFSMLRDIARGYQEGGADYIYALMTGYVDPPANFKLNDGMSYNTAFPGHQIGMPPPLSSDPKSPSVKYQDGTGSLDANARDVTAFLAWAADPSLTARKQLGWQVMLYLIITTLLLYLGKRRLWAKVAH